MDTSIDSRMVAEAPSPSSTHTSETPEPLEEALKRLARGASTDLDSLLYSVESDFIIGGTKIVTHCHCLKLDGNGRPRVDDLVKAVADHVLDYAIPRSEIQDAVQKLSKTGSTQKIVRLTTEARSLFTDLDKSGEGGELLLFVLAEKILRLPQLICKMSLKTNVRMHYHGADGLHAGADDSTGKLLLYWGESKVYGDVASAVRDCLASIRPMLADYDSSQRDLQLLQRHADLNEPALEDALKKYLNPEAEEYNSLEFRGLCLVGFDCEAYPTGPSPLQLAALAEQIVESLPTWRGHVKKRVGVEQLEAFAMHFLFVPFPSADDFREKLRDTLGLTKQEIPSATGSISSTNSPSVVSGATEVDSVRTTSAPRATGANGTKSRTTRAKKGKGAPNGAA